MTIAPGLYVTREPVAGSCPECGSDDLATYPVLSTGGWYQVVKCQQCLRWVKRTKWNRLGYVDRDQAVRLAGMREAAAR